MFLFPQPKSVALEAGQLPKPPPIVSSQPPLALPAASLTALGFEHGAEPTIRLHLASSAGDGYSLKISPRGIDISAANEAALFHGLATLRQILSQCEGSIPCLIIEDAPDLPVRGFMLDISRCKVPTMASIYQLIDLLAALKYNQLQLYTEHTFAYPDHKIVWKDASPLTPEEVRSIDRYCHDRYIELVPNQNSFGHMERWLRHDEYKHLAESPNGFQHPLAGWKQFGSTLKPTHESISFVGSLFDELLPNFRSRQVNIGGDEPWELGEGCSRKTVAQVGKHRVYLDHLLGICDRVSNSSRQIQFWGDIIIQRPELVSELPKNLIGLLWGYEVDHPFPEQCAAMQSAGAPFIVVPGTSTWNSIGGRLDTALANIESATRGAAQFGAEGILLTEWGDNGHHQNHLARLPPMIYAAGMSWNLGHTQASHISSAIDLFCHELLSKPDQANLVELGRLPSLVSAHLHNGSWLNKALFANPAQLATVCENIAPAERLASKDLLNSIEPNHPSLLVSKRLLSHAISKIESFRDKLLPPRIPAETLSLFEEDWLAYNRPGGLEESAKILSEANV